MATDLDAPITAVTVFRDGARVVRTGVLDLAAGLRPVVVGGLPPSADPASVRVAVRGHDVALLEVEVERGYGADPVRAEVVRLRSEAESCRDTVQALADEDAAEQARLGFAGHLSESAATALARAVGSGRAGHDELARMADHLAASTASALERRREIAARKRADERELQAAEQRLADAERRAGAAEFTEVSAAIEATADTRAEIELAYHVPGASWQPLYDLGLSGELLTVSYLAQVIQRTGEDWPAVPLVLSTTRRGRHSELPELRPWYISRRSPESPPGLRMRARSAMLSAGGPAEEAVPPGFAAAAQPVMAPQAAPMTAELGESAAGQVYHVPRPLAVPADGNPHKTTISRFDLDAAVDHLTVPVLAPEAYLRATMTNTSPLLLLAGPARIFHDGQFAGETALQTVAAGEEFELQLGVDDQIRIERKLHRRATSKAVIGSTRTVDIAYETTIENHRPGQVRISVHDHIPVSADAEIKVRLREASPAPAGQTDLGELTWELALPAGQSATIRHRFTVEHPAQVSVAGL
ncbi:MAG TPA: DUF4139 domain-containing protein [Streptosporangiaceae bacterium]|nr:DUF4139 domain-containing protein [Streptosporangiaceae bacterium]